VPEEICPRVKGTTTSVHSSPAVEWILSKAGPRAPEDPNPDKLPPSPSVKRALTAFNEVQGIQKTGYFQSSKPLIKSLCNLGGVRYPSVDPALPFDLSKNAALDEECPQAQLLRIHPTAQVSLPYSFLDRSEQRARDTLSLASQIDLYSSTLVKMVESSAKPAEMNQIILSLAFCAENLSVTGASALTETLRAKRLKILEHSPKFLTENSKTKLLSAPTLSPYLFGGTVGKVLADDKEERVHLSVASRSSFSGFRAPQRKRKRPASSPTSAPPAKKQGYANLSVHKPAASAGFPSGPGPSYPGRNPDGRPKRGRKHGKRFPNTGNQTSFSKTSYGQPPRNRP
jgi:hypothetical protein